jgi:site-specific recombinase XerD
VGERAGERGLARPGPDAEQALPAGAELVDGYLAALHAERHLSEYTLRNYRSDLFDLMEWLELRKVAPGQISRSVFREYLSALAARGSARASVTRRVSTVHAFYRHLAREQILERDPLEGVRPPRRERRLPSLMPEHEAARVMEMPDGDQPAALRDRAILELLYGAGLRVSELAGLDIDDLDRDDWTVRVTGKGNKQRVALYGRPAADALDRYVSDGRALLARDATRALFLNGRGGGRLSVRAIELLVQKYAARAGVDRRIYPHLLRHSFATHLIDGGADVRIVQELLGHESAGTTQIYTHVTEERQRQVYTEAFYNQWHPRSERRAARSRRQASGSEPQERISGSNERGKV